jgi:hypothetical protein
LFSLDDKISRVYFPHTGVVSLVTELISGQQVEVIDNLPCQERTIGSSRCNSNGEATQMRTVVLGLIAAASIFGSAAPGLAQDRDLSSAQGPGYEPGSNAQRDWRESQGQFRRGQFQNRVLRDEPRRPGRDGSDVEESQIAQFRFALGNSRVDIRCPANDYFQECLKAAGQLIGQMSDMAQSKAAVGTGTDAAGGSATESRPRP